MAAVNTESPIRLIEFASSSVIEALLFEDAYITMRDEDISIIGGKRGTYEAQRQQTTTRSPPYYIHHVSDLKA